MKIYLVTQKNDEIAVVAKSKKHARKLANKLFASVRALPNVPTSLDKVHHKFIPQAEALVYPDEPEELNDSMESLDVNHIPAKTTRTLRIPDEVILKEYEELLEQSNIIQSEITEHELILKSRGLLK